MTTLLECSEIIKTIRIRVIDFGEDKFRVLTASRMGDEPILTPVLVMLRARGRDMNRDARVYTLGCAASRKRGILLPPYIAYHRSNEDMIRCEDSEGSEINACNHHLYGAQLSESMT
jgi:hypothetical protein